MSVVIHVRNLKIDNKFSITINISIIINIIYRFIVHRHQCCDIILISCVTIDSLIQSKKERASEREYHFELVIHSQVVWQCINHDIYVEILFLFFLSFFFFFLLFFSYSIQYSLQLTHFRARETESERVGITFTNRLWFLVKQTVCVCVCVSQIATHTYIESAGFPDSISLCVRVCVCVCVFLFAFRCEFNTKVLLGWYCWPGCLVSDVQVSCTRFKFTSAIVRVIVIESCASNKRYFSWISMT